MKSFSCTIFSILIHIFQPSTTLSNQLYYPSADATLRKDKRDTNFGFQSHMTITKHESARSRIGLMKFDTTNIYKDGNFTASLMLHIDSTDDDGEYRTVNICKVHPDSDFEEDEVTWKNYEPGECSGKSLSFDVHRDDAGRTGQINIAELINPEEDSLVLTLRVESGGHIKLASKDHPKIARIPRLLVSQQGGYEDEV